MYRVKYNKSPLVEVIFQLRFPTILALNNSQPVEFQEAIRADFPLLQIAKEITHQMLPSGEKRIVGETNRYEFLSKDGKTKITVTSSFIAFSTLEYDRWEYFKKLIESISKCFCGIYHVPFFLRVGLRYKDAITKSQYGMQDSPWSALVKPEVVGIIAEVDDKNLITYSMDSEYKQAQDNTFVHNRYALVKLNDNAESSLLLDCDYFCKDMVELEAMLDMAECLHSHSSNFIASAITPELETAMQPIQI